MSLSQFIAACEAVSSGLSGFDAVALAALQATEAISARQLYSLAIAANVLDVPLSFA